MKLIILAMITLWLWTRYRRKLNILQAKQRLDAMKALDRMMEKGGESRGHKPDTPPSGPYLRCEPIRILDKDKNVVGEIHRNLP